jgi:hypothetical protein
VTGKDRAALVLIVLAFVASIVEIFWRPFGIALPALVLTMIGIAISDKYRRLGWYATLAITIGFLIGASFAVWDSRPIY